MLSIPNRQAGKAGRPDHRGERGAAAILFAVALPILLAMVAMVTDLGYAYYSKQRLQDTLDLAALAAARELPSTAAAQSAAVSVLIDNGFSAQELQAIEYGTYQSKGGPGQPYIYPSSSRFRPSTSGVPTAARLSARVGSPSFFASVIGIDELNVAVRSTAVQSGELTSLSIRSGLADVDSSQSPLLNLVLGSLLGSSVNLTALAYNGLLNTSVDLLEYLDLLSTELNLNVGTYEELLNTDVSVGVLADVMLKLLQRDAPLGEVDATLLSFLSGGLNIPNLNVRLGDIVGLATGTPDAALELGVFRDNFFNLLNAVIQVASNDHALSVGLDVGGGSGNSALSWLGSNVVSAKIRVAIVEKPQTSAVGGVGIYVRTAQVRLLVSVGLPVMNSLNSALNAVLGLVLGLIGGGSGAGIGVLDNRLDLYVEVANADATVTEIICNVPRDQQAVRVKVNTGLARLYLGKYATQGDEDIAFGSSTVAPPVPGPLNVLSISKDNLLGILGFLVDIDIDIGLKLQAGPVQVGTPTGNSWRQGPTDTPLYVRGDGEDDDFPQTKTVGVQGLLTGLVKGLINPLPVKLDPNPPVLTLRVLGIPLPLGGVLGGIVTALQGLLNTLVSVLTPILDLLDGLVFSLLDLLGVTVGTADVTVNFLQCGNARLVN